jgi:hypothetical protein
MRPGVNVTTRDNAPPSTIPTDVGTGFMVAVTEAGPSIPTANDLVQNMDEFKAKYAPTGRSYTAAITANDSAETFFGEGGNRLYVGRVRGPASVAATVNLNDSGAAIALVATARGVGEWGNGLDIVVRGNAEDSNIPVGSFRLRVVQRTGGAVLSESYDLVDNAAPTSVWRLARRRSIRLPALVLWLVAQTTSPRSPMRIGRLPSTVCRTRSALASCSRRERPRTQSRTWRPSRHAVTCASASSMGQTQQAPRP